MKLVIGRRCMLGRFIKHAVFKHLQLPDVSMTWRLAAIFSQEGAGSCPDHTTGSDARFLVVLMCCHCAL